MNLDLGYGDKEMILKMIGVYVSERRSEMNLTPSAFHKLTGISVQRLKRIECGEVDLRPKTIEVLTRTLNLDENRLEAIAKVAKVEFINQFMDLMWNEAEPLKD